MPPANQNNQYQPNVFGPQTGGPVPGFDPNVPIQQPKKPMNVLLIPMIIAVLFLIGALVFGFWAFLSREDYKNNSDQKSAAAVAAAKKTLSEEKEAEFLEREKEPLKTYEGPATFGSLEISYPKTWSAFVTQADKSPVPIDGYMHPNFVPGLDSGTKFALHFQVLNSPYADELKRYEADTRSGKVTVSPTNSPKVPGVAGVRIVGEIERDKKGTVVMFPLRDKTLKLVAESEEFTKDFDTIILANLVFSP